MRRARLSHWSVTFLCCLLAVPTLPKLVGGISYDSLYLGVAAGAALGLVYLLVRPVLRILTLPIGCLTLGLFGYGLDAAMIYALGEYLPGFHVASLESALLAAVFLSAVQMIAYAFNR